MSKLTLKITFICIVLLVVLSIYKSSLLKNRTSTSFNVYTSPAPNITENWETYTHPTLKFSIKHPTDIVIANGKDFSDGVYFVKKSELYPLNRSNYSIKLDILKRSDNGGDPLEALKMETCGGCVLSYESAQINNAIGVRNKEGYLPQEDFYITDLQKKGPVVRIFLQTYQDNPDNSQFIEMIKTFTFVR